MLPKLPTNLLTYVLSRLLLLILQPCATHPYLPTFLRAAKTFPDCPATHCYPSYQPTYLQICTHLLTCVLRAANFPASQCHPGCLLTYLPTYATTFVSTYVPTFVSTYVPTFLSTYVPTLVHTYVPTYALTYQDFL